MINNLYLYNLTIHKCNLFNNYMFVFYVNQLLTIKAAPAIIFLFTPPSAFIGKRASKLLLVLSV